MTKAEIIAALDATDNEYAQAQIKHNTERARLEAEYRLLLAPAGDFDYEEHRDALNEERGDKWDQFIQPEHGGFGGVWDR